MHEWQYYLGVAFPFLGLLILLTVFMPSWRWVAGFIFLIGITLLYFRISYSTVAPIPGGPHFDLEIPSDRYARAVSQLLLNGFAIASAVYLAGLLWWHTRPWFKR
jgi:hypothetical protein